MSAAPQPDPTAQGAGDPAPQAAPSQTPAPPELMMLSRITMMLKQLAQSRPELSPGLTKAMQGINEAQSSLVTSGQPQPATSTPPL